MRKYRTLAYPGIVRLATPLSAANLLITLRSGVSYVNYLRN